jgi:hypothetical protein
MSYHRAHQTAGVKSKHIQRRQQPVYAEMPDPVDIDRDWVGFDKSVALDDVKLKFIKNLGLDIHDHNLWEQQARALARKPAVEGAVEPLEDLLYSRNWGLDSLYKGMENLGASHVSALPGPLQVNPTSKVDVYTDRRDEIYERMQDMGIA